MTLGRRDSSVSAIALDVAPASPARRVAPANSRLSNIIRDLPPSRPQPFGGQIPLKRGKTVKQNIRIHLGGDGI